MYTETSARICPVEEKKYSSSLLYSPIFAEMFLVGFGPESFFGIFLYSDFSSEIFSPISPQTTPRVWKDENKDRWRERGGGGVGGGLPWGQKTFPSPEFFFLRETGQEVDRRKIFSVSDVPSLLTRPNVRHPTDK